MIQDGCLGHVMLIDDEQVDQMIYKRILARSKMAKSVVGFVYAEEALAYLTNPDTQQVDLILLDINMPRMNGFEFLEAVQEKLGPDFETPVLIMLTTSLNPSDRTRAESYKSVKAYLNKPLDQDHLGQAARILEALSSGR